VGKKAVLALNRSPTVSVRTRVGHEIDARFWASAEFEEEGPLRQFSVVSSQFSVWVDISLDGNLRQRFPQFSA